jgi:hypothetical protein
MITFDVSNIKYRERKARRDRFESLNVARAPDLNTGRRKTVGLL